jgi:hypothetical protein
MMVPSNIHIFLEATSEMKCRLIFVKIRSYFFSSLALASAP